MGRGRHELGMFDGGRIDADFIRTRIQQLANVLDRADSTADRQRHEYLFGRSGDDVQQGVPILMRSGNVQEAQFIGTGLIIDLGDLDRITGVTKIHEADALDHSTVLHVQTWNDAFGQHRPIRFMHALRPVPRGGPTCLRIRPSPR